MAKIQIGFDHPMILHLSRRTKINPAYQRSRPVNYPPGFAAVVVLIPIASQQLAPGQGNLPVAVGVKVLTVYFIGQNLEKNGTVQ